MYVCRTERISEAEEGASRMKSYSRVYAEVDLDAIRSNMEAFRRNVPETAMLCAVVKTDGYGLGAVPIARTVNDLVWGFATATIDEAVNLRRHGIDRPILVLGYVPREQFEELVNLEIRYAAFKLEEAEYLSKTAAALGKTAYVHVKTDTGMGRIGLMPEEVPQFIRQLGQMPGISVEGLFSHLATADMLPRDDAWKQVSLFEELEAVLQKEGIRIPVCHLGNSAASMEMTGIRSNLFRVGIALYGYYPSEEMDRNSVKLKPAMTLKTRIIHRKKVPAGTPIGYGGTYVTEKETVVATVSIGYGDGYPRSLSNRGEMLVRGHRVPIIGRVCMDQTMLDVSCVPDVQNGDTVTVIGSDGAQEITVEEASMLAGSFNYEFLCDLGKRIPRVYLRNGRVIGTKDYFEDPYFEE